MPERCDPATLATNCVWVGGVEAREELLALVHATGLGEKVQRTKLFEEAQCAFLAFDSYEASQEFVKKAKRKVEGKSKVTVQCQYASRHIWVGQVAKHVTEQHVFELFSQCGPVESVRILRANKCAFVNYFDAASAVAAVTHLNHATIQGQEVIVNFQWTRLRQRDVTSCPGFRAPYQLGEIQSLPVYYHREFLSKPSRQLFVGNLGPSVRLQDLIGIFSYFGGIQTVRDFRKRGFAFILYENMDAAIAAKETVTAYPAILDHRVLSVNYGKQVD